MSGGSYYVPAPSFWPIIGSVALFFFFLGAFNWLHHDAMGPYFFAFGCALLVFMLVGWFGTVIRESEAGLYNEQVERTYRWSMMWFIFSEVCFFGAFFSALFYARIVSVPVLSGEVMAHPLSHLLLWPEFESAWPVLVNPDNFTFVGAYRQMEAWELPALNTLILLTSGVTVTWAHWALKMEKRRQLIAGLLLTVLLGCTFLFCQVIEYQEAYHDYNLTLDAGIYGTTFFTLTGFHGLHVTIGTIMLMVILGRAIKGHFTPEHHFAFEGVAWYWHFVDVVWLFLFVFVYWL